MCYIVSDAGESKDTLGLVEFEQCAIFLFDLFNCNFELGLVEFEQCAIFPIRSSAVRWSWGL